MYTDLPALLGDQSAWAEDEAFDAPLNLFARSAYHLGEIRRSLCMVSA